MAGTSLTFKVEVDDRAVRAALGRLVRAGQDLQPAFRAIGELLLNSHRERWAQAVDPDGRAWAPLSPKYAARKAATRPGRGLLVLDGYLKDNLHYQADPSELFFGTGAVSGTYAATHQFGRAEANIPARPFIGLSSGDRTEIVDALNDYLADATRG